MSDIDALRAAARAAAHDERTLAFLRGEEARLTGVLRAMRRRHADEKRDVDELEGLSLVGLFQRVLGTHADRLSKERRELAEARMQLDAARAELGEVQQRIGALELERERRELAVRAHEQALERSSELRDASPELARRLADVRGAIEDAEKREHELSEALAAADEARERLAKLCRTLESASSWGSFDLLGGGFLANLGKHSELDEARWQIAHAQTALRKLANALGETGLRGKVSLDVGGRLSVADYLLDGLIVDWIVQKRIAESLERARAAELAVIRLRGKLTAAHGEARGDAERCRKRRDELLSG